MTTKQISLPVTGMTCAMCVNNVERSLKSADGVVDVTVNLATEKATVDYDADRLNVGDLAETLQDSGYGVAAATVDLPITGMTCAMCQKNVERALNRCEGVISANVNLASEKANVSYLPGTTRRQDLVDAVERAGYGVIDTAHAHDHEDHEAIVRQGRDRPPGPPRQNRRRFHHPAHHPQHGAPFLAPGPFPDGQLRLPGRRHLALHLRRASHPGHVAAGPAIHQRRRPRNAPRPRQYGRAGGDGRNRGLRLRHHRPARHRLRLYRCRRQIRLF